MRLVQPKEYKETLTIDGVAYAAFGGIVTIPDEKVHDGLFALGFYNAPEKANIKKDKVIQEKVEVENA